MHAADWLFVQPRSSCCRKEFKIQSKHYAKSKLDTRATIRNINNKEQVMIFCSGLYCPQLYWSNMHPSFRCVNAHVTYHFYIVQVSHSCPTSHHYPTHTTPLSHFPHPVLPLHIWTVVSGAFRGVPCLSIVLFTSPRRPA